MRRNCLRSLTFVLFTGLMLTLIVQVVRIHKVEAKSKGINIVKDEASYLSIPLDQKKRQELYKLYRSSTTETEKASYLEQMQEYDNELQEWYNGISDPEKEEEVREKQELLEHSLRKAGFTEKGKENLKKIPPFTRIGYDMIDHSLEISLAPKHFTDKEIKETIKYIRKIIGDEIDLTISQATCAKHPVEHRK